MSEAKPSDIKCSRAYWTHGVVGPYTLKAEQRLGVLVGLDRRLTPAAGVVFRFLISWDMEAHGNALASVDFISAALKAQDPAGLGLSSSAVGAALKLLRETGWITQTLRGTGPKNASRYEPAWEALTLASRGAFPSIVANRPEVVDSTEPSRGSGTRLTHFRRAERAAY
jgi:DNA-binding transcriptional ArsR family regulator